MTTAADVLQRYLGAIDAHDLAGVRACLAPDTEVVAPGVELHGEEQVVGWIQVFLVAFPDLAHEVRSVLEVDGGYAAEVRFSGTHTGPLASPAGEIGPTGKAFAFDYVHVSGLAGEQILSDHIYFDQLGFLSQLGLLPA
ncbi:MAG TPA: ester cyclase [Actinomycetota bacterium]|nr:ester cyclase [Actinomycetota bacterium]